MPRKQRRVMARHRRDDQELRLGRRADRGRGRNGSAGRTAAPRRPLDDRRRAAVDADRRQARRPACRSGASGARTARRPPKRCGRRACLGQGIGGIVEDQTPDVGGRAGRRQHKMRGFVPVVREVHLHPMVGALVPSLARAGPATNRVPNCMVPGREFNACNPLRSLKVVECAQFDALFRGFLPVSWALALCSDELPCNDCQAGRFCLRSPRESASPESF